MMPPEIHCIHDIHKEIRGPGNGRIVLDIGDKYLYIPSSITNQLFKYVHLFR